MPRPTEKLPRPMRPVLVEYGGRWFTGVYCIDNANPGWWHFDGQRQKVGAYAPQQWVELPPLSS